MDEDLVATPDQQDDSRNLAGGDGVPMTGTCAATRPESARTTTNVAQRTRATTSRS
jgi:hypothetical protein